MTTETPKPIHSLILDSGPIIKNDPHVSTILGQAENIYTIPAVIDEIRDAVTRARLESTLLPFLKLRSPRPASVKVITDFARKTGDLEVLSRPDIHLMALAYELECERNNGDWRLRSDPNQKKINGEPPKPVEENLTEDIKEETVKSVEAPAPAPETRGAWGTSVPRTLGEDEQPKTIDEVLESTHISTSESQNPEDTPAAILPTADEPASVAQSDTPVQVTEDVQISTEVQEIPTKLTEESQAPVSEAQSTEIVPESTSSENVFEVEDVARSSAPDAQAPEPTPDSIVPESLVEEVEESDSEGSDGEGWITPSNLKKVMAKSENGATKKKTEAAIMQVALITSDFAMQNVLLRMNLNLLSPTLQRIKQLKTWVLRCHACFAITKDMTKQFCGRCGKPTLMRTSCTTDKDGKVKVHLKKNMQWNKRGDVYSIPKPVAGTSNGKLVQGGGKGGWGQGLILAEDQKEYIQAMTGARRKKEKDLMDEDFLPGLLSGDRGRAGGRTKVGAGRNVNSKKRH
ncbi:Nin1 binding protein [Cadophora gregata]|uniref:Nin1 binding protein n=1 Tax=Cadophora gregata TaxID=51156 RepID=UPI0026DBA60A|nr:Nin1 binding protein [Cadophora gregata]KAK0123989.1 Nin1 binding protein [Cadophora gregata]KAK0130328.1 Nin1 binding protein [Cadophora gregata f. sp. sojae]